MSAFTKLRESDFSATEKRIADYILKNAHKLPEITISTVAKDCDTSKSMVVQLCKTAGFKGYKDLCSQLLVEQALSDQKGGEAMDYDEIHPGCTMAQICQITLREESNRSIIPRYRKSWFPALTPPRTTTSFLLTKGADHQYRSPCTAPRAQALY